MIYTNLPIESYCCKEGVTAEEQLFLDFFEEINNCVYTNLSKAYAKEIFGYSAEQYFNAINNVYYLFDILMWIHRDWLQHPDNTKEDYYAMFSIECWKKAFMCCGCNINKALQVFDLGDPINIITTTPNPYDSGETPRLENDPASTSICSEVMLNVTLLSSIVGSTITWSRDVVIGITNAAATGGDTIHEILINTELIPVDVIYVVTINYGGHVSTTNYTVTVNPTASLTSSVSMVTTGNCCCETLSTDQYCLAEMEKEIAEISIYDLEVNGVLVASHVVIVGPFNPQNILNQIYNTTGYEFTYVAGECLTITSPIGTGSGTNGDDVKLIIYDTLGVHISTFYFIMDGGVDGVPCPEAPIVPVAFVYTPTANIVGTTFTWTRDGIYQCDGTTGSPTSGVGGINENLFCPPTEEIQNIYYTFTLTTPLGCISIETIKVRLDCKECIQDLPR